MHHEICDQKLTLHITNKMDASTAERDCIEAKTLFTENSEIKKILIDISDITTTDSLGINFLVDLYRNARNLGIDFKVTGVCNKIHDMLAFFRLEETFGIPGKLDKDK